MTMLTTAEAAVVLRESPITTMRRCARGDLPATKKGRNWLISDAALAAFLEPTNQTTDQTTDQKPEYVTASQKRQALRQAS